MSGEPPAHGQPLHGRLRPRPAAMPSRLRPGTGEGSPLRHGWGREANGPDRPHAAGAPPLPQARRVSALPARVPSGLYPRFHGVARRTSLSSSPGGTPGWTSAAGRPRASDDRRPVVGARGRQTVGMVPRAPLPRRGIVARRPSSPKGRHDGHRREPCFCYTPGAALSAVAHCEARARQGGNQLAARGGWQPTQARAVPGGCLRCAAGQAPVIRRRPAACP